MSSGPTLPDEGLWFALIAAAIFSIPLTIIIAIYLA